MASNCPPWPYDGQHDRHTPRHELAEIEETDDMTQETADFSEPPPGYTRSEAPHEQMCITSEGLFFNSDRGWHRSDGRPLRWLTFEAAWAEHKAACPMASDIQQGLLLGGQLAEIEETLRQPWPRTNGQPQDIDTIVRLLREEASEISAKDYARIMMREGAHVIVALASELAAKDEQVRTGPASPERVPEALDASTRAERERVLALAVQMSRMRSARGRCRSRP